MARSGEGARGERWRSEAIWVKQAGKGQVRAMGRGPARKGGQRPLGNGSQGFLRALLFP